MTLESYSDDTTVYLRGPAAEAFEEADLDLDDESADVIEIDRLPHDGRRRRVRCKRVA
jgi:hypothetical protein